MSIGFLDDHRERRNYPNDWALDDETLIYRPDLPFDIEKRIDPVLVRQLGEKTLLPEIAQRLEELPLHQCLNEVCGDSGLVYPKHWQQKPHDQDLMRIETRCPECEILVERNVSLRDVAIFDDELADGNAALNTLLKSFEDGKVKPADFK